MALQIGSAAMATTYYVAANGNDSNTGTSSSTPFQTISRVNQLTLVPGDSILFKGGDVFRGTLQVSAAGSAVQPIIIASYGNGKAIISGSELISNWTAVGTSTVYTASIPGMNVLNLFIDKVQQQEARYPNAHRYLQLDSAQTTYLKDAGLSSLPANYFSGAKVCVHTAQWCWEKSKIQQVSGTTLTYATPLNLAAISKFGYFLYGSGALLDTVHEFYADSAAQSISYFAAASVNPNATLMEGTVRQFGVQVMNGAKYLSIMNIQFEQQFEAGIYLNSGAQNIVVTACSFYSQYHHGIASRAKWVSITQCSFEGIGGQGVAINTPGYVTLSHSTFKNIGLVRNYGIGGQTNGSAIAVNFTDSVWIHHNTIDSTGYCGISADGKHNLIERNVASHCMLVNNDGAPFKAFGNQSQDEVFRNNFALYTYGNKEGTFNASFKTPAYYFDLFTNQSVIENNTAYEVPGTGVFLNCGSFNNRVSGNVIYGGTYGININGSLQVNSPITNTSINGNVLFGLSNADYCLRQIDYTNTFATGPIDSNYLIQPYAANRAVLRLVGTTPNQYDLAAWQTASGNDLHSKGAFMQWTAPQNDALVLMNPSDNWLNVPLGDTSYLDLDSVPVCGSIQVAPYTSKILINTHQYVACQTGVAEMLSKATWTGYPNPFTDQLKLQFDTPQSGEVNVLDIQGRKVWESPINNAVSIQFSTANWPSGMYLIQFQGEVKRVIKQ